MDRELERGLVGRRTEFLGKEESKAQLGPAEGEDRWLAVAGATAAAAAGGGGKSRVKSRALSRL